MKAIQYSRLGGPEVLQYVTLLDPSPKSGEALISVKAAGFNHLDIHFRKGLPGMKTSLPHIPGSDGAGVVASVGEGVTQFKTGDRVVLNPGYSCGVCEACQIGQASLCHKYRVFGREFDGTYAELVSVPQTHLIPIPDHISFEIAAAAPLVYLTAWSMVVTKGNVSQGDTVLVMSAGSGVSMAAIQIAKLRGARVFATASTRAKADRAKRDLGVDEAFVYTEGTLDQEIRSITQKRGVDLVIDHLGGDMWVPLLRCLRNGGTLITCGATLGFDPKEDLRQIFYRQTRVLGSTMGTDAELFAVMRLIFEERMTPILDKVFPLEAAAEAHRYVESRQSFGKVILQP